MKTIGISELGVNPYADTDLYSSSGELLISRGKAITPDIIDTLIERDIAELYALEPADSLIAALFTTPFQTLDQISVNAAAQGAASDGSMVPPILNLPAIKHIKAGRAGFEHLSSHPKAVELDAQFKSGGTADSPCGPAVSVTDAATADAQRNNSSKQQTLSVCETSLMQCRRVFESLAQGARIEGSVVSAIVEQILRLYIADSNLLLNLANSKCPTDDFLYRHSVNVCILSIATAIAAGYNRQQMAEIGIGALLHDLGMLIIPSHIVYKKGGLTQNEWYEIQKHPVLGLLLCDRISDIPTAARFIIYQTHERDNGTGYPHRRTTRFIHRYAKVVQIADVFEALSSPRPYRDAYIPYKAMEMLIKMTHQGLVSGEYLKSLLSCVSLFPVGSCVELSDKRRAKVIWANRCSFAKPAIRFIADAKGVLLTADARSREDLSQNTNIQIVKAHSNATISGIGLFDGF